MIEEILLIGGVTALLFGLFVVMGNPHPKVNRYFGLTALGIGGWAIGISAFMSSYDIFSATIWAQIYYISAITIAVGTINTIFHLLKIQIPRATRAVIWFIFALISLTIIFYPSYLIKSVNIGNPNTIDLNMAGYLIYSVYFSMLFLSSIYILFVNWLREQKSTQGIRLGWVLGVYALSGLIGMLFNLLLPALGNYELIWAGPLAIFIFVPSLYYGVNKFGLFDIKQTTVRTASYILSLFTLAFVYFGLAYAISSFILGETAHSTNVSTSPLNILLALILAFIFQPIKHFFDQVTNRIFYRGEYDRDTFFREFGQILSYDTNLKLLLRRASSYITDNLKAERAFFQIVNRGVFGGTAHDQVSEVELSRIVKYYKENIDQSSVVVADLVQSDEVRGIMSRNNIRIALPLMSKNHLIGCLFLGEHKSRGYSARDIGVLESVTNELTIAISNSLSVEEIRDLNASLQQRVNEATKELTMTNKQLRKLDETKDEFISMASHQLRTPLTSIKGYLDMVLQGDLGKINATQRAALSDAYLSSERMVSLINDFLNISRLQTGKFIIDRRNSDVSSALYQELQMLSVLAKQHGLELDLNVDKNMPPLLLDIDKLRQVIVNMIDNAIYYSKPNTAIKIRLGIENGELIFSVQDTGIGVPKSEQDQLFGKFFRATNARKRRPDGTGVGLFLSKKVVLAHGGQIIFQSIEGDGSIFGFRIPVTVE